MKVFIKLVFVALVVSLITVLCTQIKTNKESIDHINKFTALYKAKHTPYPLQNFIYLDTYLQAVDTQNNIIAGQTLNAASGIAVKGDKGVVYAFTAGHWCSADESEYTNAINSKSGSYPGIRFIVQKRVAFFGQFHIIDSINSDPINDVCVISFRSPYYYKAKKISPARKYPEVGEEIYTSSAPLGMYSHDMRLIFSGYFGGCQTQEVYCFYTVPGIQGSSGSGVLNKSGDLISILDVSVVDFFQVTGGAKLESIIDMYDRYVK